MTLVRITVFHDRPDCILIHCPDGGSVQLPDLQSPFTKISVAQSCGKVGADFRVLESVAGRWTQAARQAASAEKSERTQRHKLAEAAKATTITGPGASDRAAMLDRKRQIDEERRQLDVDLSVARGAAAREGKYLSPDKYQSMQSRIATLKTESIALQEKIGQLGKVLRANEDVTFRRSAHAVLSKGYLDAIYEHMRAGSSEPREPA